MPYKIEKRPVKGKDDWAIIVKATGEIVGRSNTKEKAKASVRARMASEHS